MVADGEGGLELGLATADGFGGADFGSATFEPIEGLGGLAWVGGKQQDEAGEAEAIAGEAA